MHVEEGPCEDTARRWPVVASEKLTCQHLDPRLPCSRTVGSDVPLPGALPSPAQWLPRFPADAASPRATSKARDRMWLQRWSLALPQGPAVASEGSSHRGSSSSSEAPGPSGPSAASRPPGVPPAACGRPTGAGPPHTPRRLGGVWKKESFVPPGSIRESR